MRIPKNVAVYTIGMFAIPAAFMYFTDEPDSEEVRRTLAKSSGVQQSRANRANIAKVWTGGQTSNNSDVVDQLLRGGRSSHQRLHIDSLENVNPARSSNAGSTDGSSRRDQLEARVAEIKGVDDYDEDPALLAELKACRRALRDIAHNELAAANAAKRGESDEAMKKKKKKKRKKKRRKNNEGDVDGHTANS